MQEDGWLQRLAPGFMAGLATLFVGQPFDTLKVRMQTSTQKQTSFWSSGLRCLREEGALGLYKGTSPQLLGSAFQHLTRYGESSPSPPKPLSDPVFPR